MAIEKFDPSTLMQGVKDRIKSTFVSLIPDDEWNAMIQKEIDAFFQPVKVKHSKYITHSSYYSSSSVAIESETLESPFRRIVWELLNEKTHAMAKEELEKRYFKDTWLNGAQDINEEMKKLIIEAAPLAIQRIFERIGVNISSEIKDSLNRNY